MLQKSLCFNPLNRGGDIHTPTSSFFPLMILRVSILLIEAGIFILFTRGLLGLGHICFNPLNRGGDIHTSSLSSTNFSEDIMFQSS